MTPVLGVFALTSLLSPCPAQEAAENLLTNPGFEQGGETPAGWTFNHRRTDGEIAWENRQAHSGARSVRIANRTERQTGNVLQTVHLEPALEPGSRVTFSAFAAAEDAGGNGPTIIFNPYSTCLPQWSLWIFRPGPDHRRTPERAHDHLPLPLRNRHRLVG